MCFAVCAPLASFLQTMGVKCTLREVDFPMTNHVFIELPDGRILDPTADQFSGQWFKFPNVYLGPLPIIYQKWINDRAGLHPK